ncbi:helix-turn-helix transcriptional regulator [Pediococcus acidilactici]|nr:helix-turn-helix transcriptional regulator [Pediococcus acidilactici]RWY86189.1 XRE family transcriptional regulator [Pediococcus acidilactici]
MVGQRIRKEREKRGWSQNDLAKLLQVSRQTISKWETESAYPDVERLMQLSDLF